MVMKAKLKAVGCVGALALALALVPAAASTADPESPYRSLAPSEAEGLVGLEVAAEPTPETHGVSPLEFADVVRARAKDLLRGRFVELWMSEDQTHLVVGALGVTDAQAAALSEELSVNGVRVAVERREVSRAALDRVHSRLLDRLPARIGTTVARHYERGLVDISAARPAEVTELQALVRETVDTEALTGQAAGRATRMFGAPRPSAPVPRVSISLRGDAGHTETYRSRPWRSGKGLVTPEGRGCSTAFVVNGGAGGAYRYILTAGHCGPNGQRHKLRDDEFIYSVPWSRMENNTIWGSWEADVDAGVLYVNHSTSIPSIWVSPHSGGPSFARPVVAQSGAVHGGDPLVPYSWVCFSGATTHDTDSCGYISSTSVGMWIKKDGNPNEARWLFDQFAVDWWWGPGVRLGDSGGGVYGLNPDGSAIALGILSACAYDPNTSNCKNSGTAYFTKIAKALARTNTSLAATGRRPFGSYDGIAGGSGHVSVSGWVIDPDMARSPAQIHVYVGGPAGSGAPGYALAANSYRPDVGSAYPNTGNNHGFYGTVPAPRGTSIPVYVYAIDLGAAYAGNTYIGVRSVNVS